MRPPFGKIGIVGAQALPPRRMLIRCKGPAVPWAVPATSTTLKAPPIHQLQLWVKSDDTALRCPLTAAPSSAEVAGRRPIPKARPNTKTRPPACRASFVEHDNPGGSPREQESASMDARSRRRPRRPQGGRQCQERLARVVNATCGKSGQARDHCLDAPNFRD
jgi:hypothetical protein